jgi:hypothetical protein
MIEYPAWRRESDSWDDGASCAVFVGASTPREWIQEQIERALNVQIRNPSYRVIPVLLPSANLINLPTFLSLRVWADFRDGQDQDLAFRILRQGIRGRPTGDLLTANDSEATLRKYERKLKELATLRRHIHEHVIVEFERKLLDKWLDDGDLPQ